MLDCYGNAFCLSLCHTLNNPESQLNTWQSISVALFIYLFMLFSSYSAYCFLLILYFFSFSLKSFSSICLSGHSLVCKMKTEAGTNYLWLILLYA